MLQSLIHTLNISSCYQKYRWLALSPVRGMREPFSGSMQLPKLQFQSVIYGNPEQANWHESFPTHM